MPHSTQNVEDSSLEPIAIVGMACRLPGSVDSAGKLWDLLVRKGSVQTAKVPENRFNIDAHFHEDLERPGSFNVAGGYFLDGALEDFDPTFFNITPIEAMWMDPQQRKILEVCYECLESGGVSLDDVAGTNTAVFVGSFTSDYQQMSIRDPDFRHNYAATGVDPGIISNRIGNTFNLKGPSFTINTACSSSIYAIHNACNALRAHDCEAAITGGVNLILTVDQHMNTAKLGILSPTSTCHTFDASADGYGRAEGAGALYLKRLSDAIRDGDPIRGVIRSSAVNTNGKVAGMGITHPSVHGQERVVRMAYEKAGLDQSKTAYLECHGTGTPVGDPIEARAVSNAMNDKRSPENPLIIGALKANIGHSEAASGIFAVMKAAMTTESGVIPGVAGLKELNPAIDEKAWNVKVQKDTRPWPESSLSRRAGVSSFGYGGTNGHVIVEEANALFPWYQHGKAISEASYDNRSSRPFMISFAAHDKITLQRNIEAHGKVAHKFFMADLAHTLNTRRTKFPQRAFTVAHQLNEGEEFDISSFQFASVTSKPRQDIAFIFTGQGAQWAGMGVEAMNTFPTFRETIKSLDKVLERLDPPAAWRLEDVLLAHAEHSPVNEAEISQPICTAIQIAITDLFARWDIVPTVTAGHSSGEIAAAYAAGLISAPEAIIAAYYRGFAVKRHAPPGTMLAAGMGADHIGDVIQGLDNVVIACENSPNSVTLSGTSKAIREAKMRLDKINVFARELKTGQAYHSPQMDHVAPAYKELLMRSRDVLTLEDREWRQRRARMFSSVTGQELFGQNIPDQYWCDNLRSRVRFSSAISALVVKTDLESIGFMIEIGPHAALAGPMKQIFLSSGLNHFTYIPTFVRNNNSTVQLLKTAGELFIRDYPLDVDQVNAIEEFSPNALSKITRQPLLLVDLPHYQWNYDKKYWAEARFSQEQRHMKFLRHDLLGSRIAGLSDRSLVWRNMLTHKNIPWLKDHSLGNAAIFPAAAHFSLAIEALRQVSELQGSEVDGVTLRDVNISTALVIPETDDGVEVQLRLQESSQTTATSTWYSFAIESITNGRWTLHCDGLIAPHGPMQPRNIDSPVDVSKLTSRVSRKRWYDAFHRVGFQYEGSFQPLQSISTNRKYHHAAAEVQVAIESGLMPAESRYILHPSTIDACLQLIIISINAGQHKEMPHGVVPIQIEEVNLWFPRNEINSSGQAVAWTDELSGRYFNTHTKLRTESGQLVLDVKNLRCVAYEAAVPPEALVTRKREPYSQVSWKPDISTLTTADAIQLYPDLNSEPGCIRKIVELMDHRTPLTKVLFLEQQDVATVGESVHGVSTIASITFASSRGEILEASEGAGQSIATLKIPASSEAWSGPSMKDYDLVIVDKSVLARTADDGLLEELHNFIQSGGKTVFSTENTLTSEQFLALGFPRPRMRFDLPKASVIVPEAGVYMNGVAHRAEDITVFASKEQPVSLGPFAKYLGAEDYRVTITALSEFNEAKDHRIILFDIEGQLLNHLNADNFEVVKRVLCSGKPIIWLTAGVNQAKSIFGGMTQGFLRAVRSEQASAKILHLDVDIEESMESVADFVQSKLGHIVTKDSGGDTEFYLNKGVSQICRIVPNIELNERFFAHRHPAGTTALPAHKSLQGKFTEGELIFSPSSIHVTEDLAADEVEVQVDQSEIQKDSNGILLVVGRVNRLGSGADRALRHQKVIAYTRSAYCTLVRMPASSCVICGDLDSGTLLGVLPSFCSAVNAIVVSAKIQKQEHVLLLPAPLSVVWAATVLSHCLGFRLTVAADTEPSRDELRSTLQLPPESIIDAQDAGVMIKRGHSDIPIVVIAHDLSTLSQEVWRSMPPMGRFILNSTLMNQAPDALPYKRGASFHATSIENLDRHARSSLAHVLKRSLGLLQENRTRLSRDVAVTDVGLLKEGADVGIVSYNYGQSVVKIQSAAIGIRFPSDACYLLVGCLGGLGRSLTTWMMDRGCRHFVFISRSAADKPEAAQVVQGLRKGGASVRVFRADASNEKEVAGVVAQVSASQSIRGVVHAAMVLKDGMYEQMDFQKFNAAIVPKVHGALSLHKALKDIPLDFFVMTSSISAVLGNPGQSNYCAGNSFLDSLAWHRNVSGLAASSIALPMVLDVGVVAENAEIEISLGRKGMYGIDESEMLQGFETAMLQAAPSSSSSVHAGNAQIILGLEPASLSNAMSSKDTVDAYWYTDARLQRVKAEVEAAGQGAAKTGSGIMSKLQDAAAISTDVAIETIGQHIMARCSRILLRDVEDFELEGRSVADYGLDSMIGAELRNWLFKEFALDMPFQKLLAPELTFKALSLAVAEQVGLVEKANKADA